MHIGVNARAFSVSDPGGDVQSGMRLVKALDELEENELTLYGHHSIRDHFPDMRVVSSFFDFDSQIMGLFWEQAILPTLVQRTGADVLFCPNENGPIRSIGVPTVTCIHDIFVYSGNAPNTYKYLQKIRVPRIVHHSDQIATVSEFSKQQIYEEFGLSEGEIHVVYNGIDNLFFNDSNGTKIQIPEEYILFVGGMNQRKNIRGLLKTFDQIRKRYENDIELILAGPREKHIYEDVGASFDDSDVTHLGFVSAEELKYLYRNASLFLFPSLKEGFGVPPLEAMACGTPVVSSDRPCMPEILGDAPEYADPNSPVEMAKTAVRVLNDKEKKQSMIEAGKIRAEQFTWERAASETLDILKRAVQLAGS